MTLSCIYVQCWQLRSHISASGLMHRRHRPLLAFIVALVCSYCFFLFMRLPQFIWPTAIVVLGNGQSTAALGASVGAVYYRCNQLVVFHVHRRVLARHVNCNSAKLPSVYSAEYSDILQFLSGCFCWTGICASWLEACEYLSFVTCILYLV